MEDAERIVIATPFIRLDAFLKYADCVSSGGEAKVLIAEGLVSVDGETCFQRGKKLYPGAEVLFEGRLYRVAGGA